MNFTTKEKVLKALEDEPGGISGQRLGMRLGLSRCSIWKAVKALQNQGYEIEAVTNRGYRLIKKVDTLDAGEISRLSGGRVTVFDSVPSTNIIAKEQAAGGAPQGTVIMANHQSAGRGRRGRSFASAGESIYLSAVLRPEMDFSHAPLVTAAAAVAVYNAIASVCGKDCGIKWVNDLFLNGKKICGILTEAVTNMESGDIDSVIVGIGVNFSGKSSDMPEDIREIAGFVFENEPASATRNALAAAIIKNLIEESKHLEERGFIESYRAHSIVIGQRIEFNRENTLVSAVALGIDENCGLEILRSDGIKETLTAGEISIRKEKVDREGCED